MKLPRVTVGGLELALVTPTPRMDLSLFRSPVAPAFECTYAVRARPDSIDQQLSYLLESLRRRDYAESDLCDVEDALREALANGLKHIAGFGARKMEYARDPRAYRDDPRHAMRLDARLERDGFLVATITYPGHGFGVDEALAEELAPVPTNVLRLDHRGHLYLRQQAAAAAYAHNGTVLYLGFRLRPAESLKTSEGMRSA